MATPDYQLPVFSFRPNWAKGITERLSWLTDILASKTAAEQRIALRLTPRRSFEAELLVEENERTFLDLFIRRFGADEFMLPIWHDLATLTASAAVGAVSLSLDTTNREFVDGGMAILMGPDALSCEAVRIDTVSSTAVTLIGATGAAWPRGTVVHPLRRSRFSDLNPSAKGVTDDLLQGSFQFQLSQANDYDGGAEELTVVNGLPVLSPSPDWSETLDLSWARKAFSVDNKVGIPDVGDLAGRGFSAQSHRWMLEGRDALASFYRLLYRLRGRQGALWLPSFQSDLRLAADAAAGATYIDIEAVGLDYIGALVGGRERALTAAGAMLQFSSVAASPGTGVERLNLSAPLSAALAAGAVLQFVDTARLDSDDIELFHATDSDGVTQVAAPFRTFPDVRAGSAAGAVEIPVTAMNTDPCGCAAAATYDMLQIQSYSDPTFAPPGGDAYLQTSLQIRNLATLESITTVNNFPVTATEPPVVVELWHPNYYASAWYARRDDVNDIYDFFVPLTTFFVAGGSYRIYASGVVQDALLGAVDYDSAIANLAFRWRTVTLSSLSSAAEATIISAGTWTNIGSELIESDVTRRFSIDGDGTDFDGSILP